MSAKQGQLEAWGRLAEKVRGETGIDAADVRVVILLWHGELQSRIEFTDLRDRTENEIAKVLRLEMTAAMEDFERVAKV